MTGERDVLLSIAESAAVSRQLSLQVADCSRLKLPPLEIPGP